jgi:hypothetical protein
MVAKPNEALLRRVLLMNSLNQLLIAWHRQLCLIMSGSFWCILPSKPVALR